jgi:hypothetical protein
MAKQPHDRFLAEFTRAVRAVGNEFDTKGQPLQPEHIIETLERIHVEFDQTGRARLPTMLIHPDAEPKFKDVFQRLEEDPALRKNRSFA